MKAIGDKMTVVMVMYVFDATNQNPKRGYQNGRKPSNPEIFSPCLFFTLHLRRVYRSSILQKSMCSEPVQAPVRPPAIKIIALRDGPDILLFGVLYVVFHYSHHNSAQADVLEFAHLWAGRGGRQSKNSISLPGTHATRIREKIGNRVCTSVAIASLTFPA